MQPGSLIQAPDITKYIYRDISGPKRIFVGELSAHGLAIVIDSGYSATDVHYIRILYNGITGWIRPEGVRLV